MEVMADPATEQPAPRRRLGVWGWLFAVICVGFAAFWVWALFFASKEAVNKIGDRAWAARAEGICAAAKNDMQSLHDFRRIDHDSPQLAAMLAERGRHHRPGDRHRRAHARRGRRGDADRPQGPGPGATVGGRLPHVDRQPPGVQPTSCARATTSRSTRPPSTASRSATSSPASPATTTCRRARHRWT